MDAKAGQKMDAKAGQDVANKEYGAADERRAAANEWAAAKDNLERRHRYHRDTVAQAEAAVKMASSAGVDLGFAIERERRSRWALENLMNRAPSRGGEEAFAGQDVEVQAPAHQQV